MKILIEGIDGSGKDTFAKFLVEELKKRFRYNETSKISVLGEPNSKLTFGVDAKRFIETGKGNNPSEVQKILIGNRHASEKYLETLSGITILVRGFVTDKATYKIVFSEEADVGEGYRIKKWDKYIVIDTPASIADERIEKRAQPRTWREELKYLNLFREYYLAYEDALFEEKIIIVNEDIERLKKAATEMAEDIYVSTIKNQNA